MRNLLVLILVVLSGCSTNLPVTTYPKPTNTNSLATVIFYRDGGYSYALKTTFVGIDRHLISGIKRNEFTSVTVAAGAHKVFAVCYDGISNVISLPDYVGEKGWNMKALNVIIGAGETSYINVTPFWGCPEITEEETAALESYKEIKTGTVSERTL